jgi:hypothetical protein
MLYKVGDKVICPVEIQKSGVKRISIREPLADSKVSKKDFQIIYIDPVIQAYTIVIDDDMTGWALDKWHVKYWNISEKLIGKRFFDVTETIIEGKK